MPEHFISRSDAEADLLTAAAFLAERIDSADGHAEAMNTIIPLYLSKGNVDLAAELANGIDEPFSRDRFLIQVAEKCAEIDDDDYATQLADAVEEQGLRAQATEKIALIKAAKGQIDRAGTLAAEMEHPDFVLAAIAVKQSADGDNAAANSTLETITFPTARASAFLQMASAKIVGDDAAEAAALLERAATDAEEIEHNEEKIRNLCDIGTLFIEAGRKDKAIETFDKAKSHAELLENVHRDAFLGNAALGSLYAGSDELADRTLDLVTDKTQMASALLGFSREYWKREEKQDATDALDEAYEILRSQRDIETRDSRARNALMTSIAVQFAGYGNHERAIEVAEGNQDPEETMNGLSQIAQVLTLQEKDDVARQTINSIEEPANRVFALISLADVKEKAGDNEGSLTFLNEAVELVADVPQLASRASALNDLVQRFAAHASSEKARELGLANLAVIEELRDESSRAAALAQIANIYDASGLTAGEEELSVIRRLVGKIPF